ncbi:MAG: beta-N-acetylhexosaminidase [Burkholderiaceae bacterium]
MPPASKSSSFVPAARRRATRLDRGPLVVSVSGLTLSDADRWRLRHPMVGGVILFAANFRSRRQVASLCEEIGAIRSPRLLITVDHEGGRVQRFSKGFTKIPAMGTLGTLWHKDPIAACRRATEFGQTIGSELRAVGVDLSFTPVLDLDFGQSAVIGARAFDQDPQVVTMLARSLNHGLLLAGMGNCGKHFPGHGFASADSHVEVPVDKRTRAQILKLDAIPYEGLGDTLMSVMPAHVIYPRVDSKPAGFSRIWLKDVLRKQLGFKGLIFSDDLTMEGAAVAGNMAARAKAAFSAGCDMALVCKCDDADALLPQLRWRAPKGFHERLDRLFIRS